MRYTATTGDTFEVGRVDRRTLDRIAAALEMPKPPTRTVTAWGDVDEEIPILDDPTYQAQMMAYQCRLAREYGAVIAPAVKPVGQLPRYGAQLDDMAMLGISLPDGEIERLFYVLPDADTGAIAEMVLYQSTVTERGIAEARAAYNAQWMDRPISAWHVPSSPARFTAEFEARQAATAQFYDWSRFCELGGPEQSAIVCYWRIRRKLEWLEVEFERNRPKAK